MFVSFIQTPFFRWVGYTLGTIGCAAARLYGTFLCIWCMHAKTEELCEWNFGCYRLCELFTIELFFYSGFIWNRTTSISADLILAWKHATFIEKQSCWIIFSGLTFAPNLPSQLQHGYLTCCRNSIMRWECVDLRFGDWPAAWPAWDGILIENGEQQSLSLLNEC